VRASVARGDEGQGRGMGAEGGAGGGEDDAGERHRKTRHTPNCIDLRKYSRCFRHEFGSVCVPSRCAGTVSDVSPEGRRIIAAERFYSRRIVKCRCHRCRRSRRRWSARRRWSHTRGVTHSFSPLRDRLVSSRRVVCLRDGKTTPDVLFCPGRPLLF